MNRVKSGSKVDERNDEWLLVQKAPLDNLAQRKDLIDAASARSETGLVFTRPQVTVGL